MDNNTGYTGKVYFFKSMEFGHTAIVTRRDALTDNYVFLGESEKISVDFVDSREAEIEALEAVIKQAEIEHHHFLDTMSGKIQNLRAIEATE